MQWDEELAVQALEAVVASGVSALDLFRSEALAAMRALHIDAALL